MSHKTYLEGVELPCVVDAVHVADDGVSTAGHVTDNDQYCSCLPSMLMGAICRDGRVQIFGEAPPKAPLVRVYIHRNKGAS